MKLESLFSKLWEKYTAQNPSALKIFELFESHDEVVKNDHIAFRTFNDPRVNIEVLAKPFIENGYEEKGQYEFKAKKLFAKHFEHKTDRTAPRVFISELKLEECSEKLQSIIKERLDSVSVEKYMDSELILKGSPWGKPSFKTYNELREESEYAAWMYVYGYRANHFTVSVDQLKKYNSLESVNQLLKDNGFTMNSSGGEIKGSPEKFLEQSSIMSEKINFEFEEGTHKIPACYYEFARRYKNKEGVLYSGFIADSADKIFESTNFYK